MSERAWRVFLCACSRMRVCVCVMPYVYPGRTARECVFEWGAVGWRRIWQANKHIIYLCQETPGLQNNKLLKKKKEQTKKKTNRTSDRWTRDGEAGRNVLLQQHLCWPDPCSDSGLFWTQPWHGEMMRQRSWTSVRARVCSREAEKRFQVLDWSLGDALNLLILGPMLFLLQAPK